MNFINYEPHCYCSSNKALVRVKEQPTSFRDVAVPRSVNVPGLLTTHSTHMGPGKLGGAANSGRLEAATKKIGVFTCGTVDLSRQPDHQGLHGPAQDTSHDYVVLTIIAATVLRQ